MEHKLTSVPETLLIPLWARAHETALSKPIIRDEGASAFITAHPDALVVNMGVGLCTRFSRVNNGRVTWYELDLPQVIALRREFFDEIGRYRTLTGSVTATDWMAQIPRGENQPLLFIGEGLFMYFDEPTVKRIFFELAHRFPGTKMLFEMLGPIAVGRSKHHDAVSKMDERPEFKWGIPSGAICAEWGPGYSSYKSGTISTATGSVFAFCAW